MPDSLTHNGLTITVREATLRDGLRRAKLEREAQAVEETDPDIRSTRQFLYPRLAACIEEVEPDFETFLELPETFVNEWYRQAAKRNPHWFEMGEPDPKDSKPTPTGSTESSDASTTPTL